MPDEPINPSTETPASTTGPTQPTTIVSQPASSVREPTTAELAKLGIDTKADGTEAPAIEQKGAEHTELTTENLTPENPSDFIGKALKGRGPARSFEGLDESEIDLFKNMSRSAYEKFYPLYTKMKKNGVDVDKWPELQAKLKSLEEENKKPRVSSYFDHQDAHLLNEDYRSALLDRSTAQDKVSFWEKQLSALKSSQPIHSLEKNARGELVVTGPFEASPQAEAYILRQLMESSNELQNVSSKLGQIAEASRNSYKDYNTKVGEYFTKLFGPYEKDLQEGANFHLNALPEFARSRPETRLAAFALAALQNFVNQQNATAKTQAAARATSQAAKSNGPSANNIPASVEPKKQIDEVKDYEFFRQKFGVRG